MQQLKLKKHIFRKCWTTPEPIKEFIRRRFQGRVLNLCCGDWLCGEVNVDMETKGVDLSGNQVIQGDVRLDDFNLDQRFDVVFSDPPWNWSYPDRAALNRAAARHLIPGGLFMLNAPWLPTACYFHTEEVWVIGRDCGLPVNAALLSISKFDAGKWDTRPTGEDK